LSKIKPSEDEQKRVVEAVKKLIDLVKFHAEIKGVCIKPILVGSVAKGTYMKNPDVDIFMAFPVSMSREELERYGLEIGRAVLGGGEERYAEHPYVHGKFEGFEVDLVPCYALETTTELMSAVDRTPFHTEYVKKHLPNEKIDDVLLLKRFLKGLGIYGAEAEVQGFSGYLCELFIIKFGSFSNVIENCRRFRKGTKLSIDKIDERYYSRFTDPLIFIDPVDIKRNVASPVSLDNFLIFTYACERYYETPKLEFFYPKEKKMSREELDRKIKQRGTRIVAITTGKPNIVADNLFSQLRRAEKCIRNVLEENGFKPIRSKYFAENDIMLIFELECWEYSNAKKHHGPEYGKGNSESFIKKWKMSEKALSKPYIENGIWTVEISREYRTAEELLKRKLPELSLGKNIVEEVKKKYNIVGIENIPYEILAKFYEGQFRWEDC